MLNKIYTYFVKASGFSAVQKLSTQIQTSYTTPIDTSQVGSVKMPHTLVDEMARSLLPENKMYSEIQPIKTTGDGNCLFNAASKSVCGNERMASELRLQTSFELINNQEFYSNHPAVIDLENYGLKHLYMMLLFLIILPRKV